MAKCRIAVDLGANPAITPAGDRCPVRVRLSAMSCGTIHGGLREARRTRGRVQARASTDGAAEPFAQGLTRNPLVRDWSPSVPGALSLLASEVLPYLRLAIPPLASEKDRANS